MKKALLIFISFLFFPFYNQAQELDSIWVTDGEVRAIARNKSTIYIGGDFTYVGPRTGSGAVLNVSTGQLAQQPLLHVVGTIKASAPDGQGGWYIGGLFKQVQGVARTYLAHILPDGKLDRSWNPTIEGWREDDSNGITALLFYKNTLYIGGNFRYVNGVTRRSVAALDATTGKVTAWNPVAEDGYIHMLSVFDDVIYIGGSFKKMGGQQRVYLAAVDPIYGSLTAWKADLQDPAMDPSTNRGVHSMALLNNRFYIGGNFD